MIYYTMLRLDADEPLAARAHALVLTEYIKGMLGVEYYEPKVSAITSYPPVIDIEVKIKKCYTPVHAWWRRFRLRRLVKRSRYAHKVRVLWEI